MNSIYVKVFAIAIITVVGLSLLSTPRSAAPDFTEQTQLKKFASQEELNEFLEAQSTGYGNYGNYYGRDSMAVLENVAAPTSADAGGAPAPSGQKAADYSTTNVQVVGVDEADFVKNDGKYIYTISGNQVVITEAFPAENARIVSIINLSESNPQEIYINEDKLVVFGNKQFYHILEADIGGGPAGGGTGVAVAVPSEPVADAKIASGMAAPSIWPGPRYYEPTTYIKVYDVSDRSNPVLKRNLELNGSYFNSRMVGDYVYAVVTVPTYRDRPMPMFSPYQRGFQDIYYFDIPDYSYQYTNVLSVNVKDDAKEMQNKVFLLGYSNNIFVSENNIYMVYQKQLDQYYTYNKVLDEVFLPALPASVAEEINSIKSSGKSDFRKQGEAQLVINEWMQDHPEEAAKMMQDVQKKLNEINVQFEKERDRSVIHKISIKDGNINYESKGEVPGQPLNQFSMDEHNGYFRIATTTSERYIGGWSMDVARPAVATVQSEAIDPSPSLPPVQPQVIPSTNNLYVLDGGMNVVGKIEDLAKGERIYSARFIGDRAYLVTFVRIDPLFVIDLSNPSDPKVLGELKIPGVSEYLHPYDENTIIGIGRSTEEIQDRVTFTGLKISLFDVSDVSNPKEKASFEIGDRGTYSDALYDHKAFLFDKERNLLVMPVTEYQKKTVDEFYGSNVYNGAYVFNVKDNEISLRGRITHANSEDIWSNSIRRSLFMDDVLYTISNGFIKANSLSDLKEISSVALPQQYYYGPYYGEAVPMVK